MHPVHRPPGYATDGITKLWVTFAIIVKGEYIEWKIEDNRDKVACHKELGFEWRIGKLI